MSDWVVYLIIFIIGGILTLLEEASKSINSVLNRKVLGFLPIKHIFTSIAVVICLTALILYCVNTANRTTAIVLSLIGILLLVIVVVIDIFIILKNTKKG